MSVSLSALSASVWPAATLHMAPVAPQVLQASRNRYATLNYITE